MKHILLRSNRSSILVWGVLAMVLFIESAPIAIGQNSEVYRLAKRTIHQEGDRMVRTESPAVWDPKKTAVIVCDVWDYHHSINAVRRLEEMLPSMDSLLRTARQSGSVVIHSPSDCMPGYDGHPARLRAKNTPKRDLPKQIASWNCKTPKEDPALFVYPLDQSDGGEDDDPQEHRLWAEKLKTLGRDPGLPWKAQNSALSIDATKDYISDRGDEVWAILQSNKIEHVIMIGVHTNMCVLGRPFGLRQLASNGIDVVLVRDLTDCMYNPKRWPYVDHYTGNDLMIGYVEQAVCPTITSDQILGGKPATFSKDTRDKKDLMGSEIPGLGAKPAAWELVPWKSLLDSARLQGAQSPLVRCSLRIPTEAFSGQVTLSHPRIKKAWVNGHRLEIAKNLSSLTTFEIEKSQTFGNDDANVLVLQIEAGDLALDSAPIVLAAMGEVTLSGSMQAKYAWQESDTNLPLPAKFALPPAVFYTLPDR